MYKSKTKMTEPTTRKSKKAKDITLALKSKKVNKELFVSSIAEKTGMTNAAVSKVVDAYHDEIIDRVSNNEEVSMTGFGRFYVQRHKGHPVQFSPSHEKVQDYVVFKFSASNVLNNRLRDIDAVHKIG